MNRRYRETINNSVNFWFHTPRKDSSSPELSLRHFSDQFLAACDRMHFQTWIPRSEFRKRICEAICIMFLANKREAMWKGPKSRPPRPPGWTAFDESEWKDMIRSVYFTYDCFDHIWSHVEEGMWESNTSGWRSALEHIALHYITVRPELMGEEYMIQYQHYQSQKTQTHDSEYYSTSYPVDD